MADVTPPPAEEKVLLRLTEEEKAMVKSLAKDLECSMNSALRVCIWRGALQVTGDPNDRAVLDPAAFYADPNPPRPRRTPRPLPGQTLIALPDTETE